MKTPHHKAFEYEYHFVDSNGVQCVAKNYIAICPGVDIQMLVRRWNMAAKENQSYVLVGEIDLKTALYTRGSTGTMIATDWQLLDHMQFHSLTVNITEVKEIAA